MASLWDRGTQAVTMTEDHAKALVTAVVDAVTERARDGQLENYRQMARLEIDLAKARDDMARMITDHTTMINHKDGEITALRTHINHLNSMLTTLVPNAANFQATMVMPPVVSTNHFVASAPIPAPIATVSAIE